MNGAVNAVKTGVEETHKKFAHRVPPVMPCAVLRDLNNVNWDDGLSRGMSNCYCSYCRRPTVALAWRRFKMDRYGKQGPNPFWYSSYVAGSESAQRCKEIVAAASGLLVHTPGKEDRSLHIYQRFDWYLPARFTDLSTFLADKVTMKQADGFVLKY
jgi:hypothetical protein